MNAATQVQTLPIDTTTCAICYDELGKAEPEFEGHKADKVFHLFHSACIRNALTYKEKCPSCRADLTAEVLTKVPNPNYSWLHRAVRAAKGLFPAIKERLPSKATLLEVGRTVLPLILLGALGNDLALRIAAVAKSLAPDLLNHVIDGSTPVLSSALIGGLPKFLHAVTGTLIEDSDRIKNIFITAVAAPLWLPPSTTESTLGQIVGSCIGAAGTYLVERFSLLGNYCPVAAGSHGYSLTTVSHIPVALFGTVAAIRYFGPIAKEYGSASELLVLLITYGAGISAIFKLIKCDQPAAILVEE